MGPYRRCMPESVASMANNMADIPELIAKIPELEQGSTVINILAEAKELGQKIIQDLDESWPFVLGGLALAMILCLVYIVLMRWFAGIMIWFSLIGVIALLSYCKYEYSCYACYVKYDEMKSAAEGGATAVANRMKMSRDSLIDLDIKQEIDDILAMKDTWLLFVIGWFVAVLLFLAGSSNAVYIAQNMTNCACSFLNISDGSRCYPDTFKNCENICPGAACYFSNYEKEKYVDYLHAYNIFGVFWGLFFVSGLGEMILAATFATWYWTFRKSEVPFFTLSVSITRTLRYHIGTVAFGSLILAICRVIRVILEYINHKLKKYDNAFVKAIMCCLRCFFWCLEKFIKFINRNAYIMCAIHGKNFCRSAKDAFNLLMRNVVRVFVLDKVTDFLLFLGKLLITAGMCALSFFVFTKEIKYYNEAIPTLNYSIIPVVFIGFGTYFIASIFFGVYSMAVDTLFLCFRKYCLTSLT
ncbi:Choline transporter-like protein 2 [Blattella germanica]|nr:Choline transporter-like protein 2 [Blattella germanica]